MSENYAVKFNKVSKFYKMENSDCDKNVEERFYALKDISFEIPKCESVGILGTNGSGKSTISKILAGLLSPDEGEVKVDGEQALIAINSGLNNKLTGLENIELKGVLLGFSKEKIKEITKSVIEFSELGEFINQPVKKYSSGMKARLGFSISINLQPDIIIVDEALSVGDKTFNEKCLNKINEMRENGKTIFFVSHSLKELKCFCNKGLWIEGGVLREYDDINIVAKNYYNYIKEYKAKSYEDKKKHREDMYANRIVKYDPKRYDKRIKRKKLRIRNRKIAISIISFILIISGVVLGNSKKEDLKLTENKSIAEIKENGTYIFIETESVEEDNDPYRRFIDKDKSLIKSIVEVSFKKDGIEIIKIPSELQYYYEKEGISDELTYYYQIEDSSDKLKKYLSKITKNEINEIYNIKDNDVNRAMNIIDSSVTTEEDKTIWKISGDEIIINNSSYENFDKDDFMEIITRTSDNLKNLDDKRRSEYFEIITNNDKELTDIINNSIESNMKIKYIDIKNKILYTRVGKLLSIDIEISDIAIINEKLCYINELIDLNTNIYVKYTSISNESSDEEGYGSEDSNQLQYQNTNNGLNISDNISRPPSTNNNRPSNNNSSVGENRPESGGTDNTDTPDGLENNTNSGSTEDDMNSGGNNESDLGGM